LTRLFGSGVPDLGSIVVGFAAFAATAAFVATAARVSATLVAAALVPAAAFVAIGSTVELTGASEIAEVPARRVGVGVGVGLDSSARSPTSLATFVASR
jgi:hypothetical protein